MEIIEHEGYDDAQQRAAALLLSDFDFLCIQPNTFNRLIQVVRDELRRMQTDALQGATHPAITGLLFGRRETQ